MVNMLDCDIVLTSSNSSPTNTFTFKPIHLIESINSISAKYELNNTIIVILQGWLWHLITHKG